MLAFVHIHKTAGTTLDDILTRSFGLRHCYLPFVAGKAAFSAEDYRRVQKLSPRLKSIAGHYVSAYGDLDRARPDIRYYTFLREPLVRCASHYQFQVQEQGQSYSFEEWIVRNIKRNPQTTRIAGPSATARDAIRMLKSQFIFVGLVENFDESLVMFRQLVGDSRLDIWYRRKRVAARDDIKHQLLNDQRTRSLLIEANQHDLELYEFVTKELYPAFRCTYEGCLESDVAEFRKANESAVRLRPRLNLLANRYVSRLNLRVKQTLSYYK